MALSKIDGTNLIAPTIPVSAGGTGTTSYTAGITVADQWRLTTTTNQGTNGNVTSNWERVDDSTWSGIGTGLTESSGIFSFPSTGIYLICYVATFGVGSGDQYCELFLRTSTNSGSSFDTVANALCGDGRVSSVGNTASNMFLFDVTNTTTHRIVFDTGSMGGDTALRGSTDYTETGFTVLRIGDT